MKPSILGITGRRRSALMIVAGLGTAAAMTLAPVAAGVAQASQIKTVPTITTTVVTNGTWTSSSDATGGVVVECPFFLYTTIPGATWIWSNTGQPGCTKAEGSFTGPGTVPVGSVTLSTTFTVPEIPQGAVLTLAADNGAEVTVNGKAVATLPVPATTTKHTNFNVPHTFTLTAADFVTGLNTISIVGTNITQATYNPAGILAKLSVSSTLTSIDLCKHTGWRQWTTPSFSNQGDCVSYLVGNGNDPTIPTP